MAGQLFGKYRGKVLSTEDLTMSGRLLCEVAALPGMALNWAMPCVPYAGLQQGFFALPDEGADVWIEFEQGDPSRPIWSGGYWEAGEEPVMPEMAPELPEAVNVLASKFNKLVLNDIPEEGGVTLEAEGLVAPIPVKVTLDLMGFTVTVGELSLKMNPEMGITLTAGESVLALTPEGLNITTPAVTVEADEVNVTAACSVEGVVEIEGEVTITGALEVTAEATVGGALEVAGAASIDGETNIAGALTAEGEVNVAGALTAEGEVNVAGEFSVEGDANFAGAQQTEGNNATIGLIEGIVVPPAL